jgi:CHAT domain-containing protein
MMKWIAILTVCSMWVAWGSEVAWSQSDAEKRLRLANDRMLALFFDAGKHEEALRLGEETMRTAEQQLGVDHPATGTVVGNLAVMYDAAGRDAQAEHLYQRVLAISEKNWGMVAPTGTPPSHPAIADALNHLATFYLKRGEYTKAKPLLQRSLAIMQRGWGDSHILTAQVLYNLVNVYRAEGHLQEASDMAIAAEALTLKLVLSDMATAAGTALQNIMQTFLASADVALSTHLNIQNEAGQRRAGQVILNRKGLIQEAAWGHQQALLTSVAQADREALETLLTRQAELSALMYKREAVNQNDLSRMAQIRQETEQIEARLGRKYSSRPISQGPSMEAIRKRLPAGTVFVEFFRYGRYNQERNTGSQEPHYAGYVLGPLADGRAEDIGEAKAIEAHVTALREALGNSGNEKIVREVGAHLYRALFTKFAPQLAGAERVLISPDGELNLIPFEVLVDEHGQYLVQRWEIGYVATARDVLRWRNPRRPGPIIAFVAPDYDGREEQKVQTNEGSSPARKAGTHTSVPVVKFEPLKGAENEGQVLRTYFPHAEVFSGNRATERALKGVRGPRILHLATHGFTLKDEEVQALPMARVMPGERGLGPLWTNPMLRSGVALAGANVRRGGGVADDGILTALEGMQLDLYDTQLVVLSACQTGLGTVRFGEGVMGLRWAFALAGARSQLFSLVEVSDPGTLKLMDAYYRNLVAKKGHAASLRAEQIVMLKNGIDPYVWASFVAYGDPGPIELSLSEPPQPVVPRPRPRPPNAPIGSQPGDEVFEPFIDTIKSKGITNEEDITGLVMLKKLVDTFIGTDPPYEKALRDVLDGALEGNRDKVKQAALTARHASSSFYKLNPFILQAIAHAAGEYNVPRKPGRSLR